MHDQTVRIAEGRSPQPGFGILAGAGDAIGANRIFDPKARQIGNIAALMVIGVGTPQLKKHIDVALDIGCSRDEITEVIMQMTVYAGFPAARDSLAAAQEVFAMRA